MAMDGLKTRKPTGRVPWPTILLEGEEKSGKAAPMWSRLATPTGWTTMGEIAVGDQVVGWNGKPTTVLAVHERGERPVYRLTFSDGATAEVCNEHLWAVRTSNDVHRRYANGPRVGQPRNLPWRIWDTDTIRAKVLDGAVVHIPVTEPVQYAAGEPLPIDPYLLGLLLGDGTLVGKSVQFTCADPELVESIAAVFSGDIVKYSGKDYAYGIVGGGLSAAVRALGLRGTGSATKFIPEIYLRASVDDRLALLQGLMDTDGGMEGRRPTYTTVSPALAAGFRELVESLGGTCRQGSKIPSYVTDEGERRQGKVAYRLAPRLPASMCPFRLGRKRDAWTSTRPTFNTPPRRTVRAVDYVGMFPVRCITVAAEDHLYLTDHFVVTHTAGRWRSSAPASGSEPCTGST